MINLSELKETFECNLDDIKDDAQLVNEYLVDDMMLGLGYNKKKDRTIKRYVDDIVDWLVPGKLVVKVYEVGHNIEEEDKTSVFDFAKVNEANVVMLTSGDKTYIYLNREGNFEYLVDYELAKAEELTEAQEVVLRTISSDEYNLDKLAEVYVQTHVTDAEIESAFVGVVKELVASQGNTVKSNVDTVVGNTLKEFVGSHGDTVKLGVKTAIGVTISSQKLKELLDWVCDNPYRVLVNMGSSSDVTDNSKELNDEAVKAKELAEKEATELKEKLGHLRGLLNDADKRNESIRESLDGAIKEKNDLESELAELRERSLADTEQFKTTIEELQNKLDGAEQTESNANGVQELTDKLESLSVQIKELEAEKDTLASKLTGTEVALNDSTAKVEQLMTEKAELEEDLQKAKEPKSSRESSAIGFTSDKENSYISQIEELSTKVAEQISEIKALKKQIEEDKKIIDNMEGADEKASKRLLESIEVDPDSERTYIAVINKELIQYEEIHTFAGRALQELFKVKRIEAQRYIFNGGVFRLIQPAERRDLVMESKAYDLEIDSMGEDEVLNKLRVLFSHFPDVIFMCKKAGKLSVETIENEDETSEFESNDMSDFGEFEGNTEETEGIGTEDFGEIEDVTEPDFGAPEFDSSRRDYMLVTSMQEVDNLIWLDHEQFDYEFETVKYIGTNDVSYDVNRDCIEMSYEQLCCKMIDAVLAIETNRGRTEILTELRAMDLSNINSLIKLCTEEYRQYPRINGTRFVVQGIENVSAAVTVVHDICNHLNIPQDALWVYIQASAVQNQLFTDYSFPEESIQLENTSMFDGRDIEEHHIGKAVIKGDALGRISITKRSLEAHKGVLKNVMAVKTAYTNTKVISVDDIVGTVATMLSNAIDNGISVDNIDFGTVIGDSRKLLSVNEMLVGENSLRVDARQYTFYLADLEAWQVAYALIKIHQTLYRDTSIAVLMNVDLDALQYYLNEFRTSEPSTSLAVRGFAAYVRSQIKQVN